MSDCEHIWVMYADLTARCTECDESRNGDALLTELQETIAELQELERTRRLETSSVLKALAQCNGE